MVIAAFFISVIAALGAGASAIFAWWAIRYTKRQAKAAEHQNRLSASQLHEEREPQLLADLDGKTGDFEFDYSITLSGRRDMQSVVLHSPRDPNFDYKVAKLGGEGGWADQVELGPMNRTQPVVMRLKSSSRPYPDLYAAVTCRSETDDEPWTVTVKLPAPSKYEFPGAEVDVW